MFDSESVSSELAEIVAVDRELCTELTRLISEIHDKKMNDAQSDRFRAAVAKSLTARSVLNTALMLSALKNVAERLNCATMETEADKAVVRRIAASIDKLVAMLNSVNTMYEQHN